MSSSETDNLVNNFKKHPISTQTVMVYINCKFNVKTIRQKIVTTPIDPETQTGVHGQLYRNVAHGEFRNQTSLLIYVIDKFITVKIFTMKNKPVGKIHLTGCKNLEHQQQAVIHLLNHIRKISTPEEPTFEMTNNQPLTVILDVVLVNIDFNVGFYIDQKKLDNLFQMENNDFYTFYEFINTSVNVKLDYNDPTVKYYDKIVITGPVDKYKVEFSKTTMCAGIKNCETRTHTFLVFDNKVIQSSRYYDSEMEKGYKQFVEILSKNRKNVELVLTNEKFDITKLKGINLPPCEIVLD
jgi:hypothetical protein